jgi:hypothetical protein
MEIADKQDGGRKNRNSAKTALKKVITGDIIRQQRRAAAISEDASTCYDRMNHNDLTCPSERGVPIADLAA